MRLAVIHLMRVLLVPMIVSVAASVGFAAHGLAALLASVTAPNLPPSVLASPPPPPEKTASPLLVHKASDSTRPAFTLQAMSPSGPPGACGAITVHAIVQSSDHDWSFASLQTKDEHLLARKGARFAGREVAFVGRETVWLADPAGQVCRVDLATPLDTATPEPRTPAQVGAKGAARPAARPVDPEIARGIRATSPTSYDIDRATFERILTSTAELMGDVRIGPDGAGGKVGGMKLSHLRQGSVLGLVGLKEGDRLDAINGIDLTSPEAGLEAYAKLRLAPHIVLKMTRDARPMELQYDVR